MALSVYRGASLYGGHPGQAARAPHSRRTQSWTLNGAARAGRGTPRQTLPLWVLRPAAHDNRVRVLLQTAIPGTHTEILFHVAFSGIQALITRLF